MSHLTPEQAAIIKPSAAGVTLLDDDGRVFRRRAIKGVGTENAVPVEWAVVELAGVRVYFDGVNVVVTRQDLMP